MTSKEWPSENRIDAIGQNGPSGEHYQQIRKDAVYAVRGYGTSVNKIGVIMQTADEAASQARLLLAIGCKSVDIDVIEQ